MEFTRLGTLKTAEDFRDCIRALDGRVDSDLKLLGSDGPLGQSVNILKPNGEALTASNRFCVHPMEGWDAGLDGTPSEHTVRRWQRFGESGAALVWGCEAFAVQRDGKANPSQLYYESKDQASDSLRQLLDALRASAGDIQQIVGLQLTHSGRFSRPDGPMAPLIAEQNKPLAKKYGLDESVHTLTDDELQAIRDRMIEVAKIAAEVGFDFVDVKACHGYLLHELFGAHTREGKYGGPFENRTRLFREVVEGIKSECPELAIGCRVSITDMVPFVADEESNRGVPLDLDDHLPWMHGFGVNPSNPLESQWDEPVRFLQDAMELGVGTFNLTVGSPYYCPHFQRPAAYPPSDGYLPPRDPLHEVIRHILTVREIKSRVPEAVLVGSGYSYLQGWLPYLAQAEVRSGHVDFVGLGRSTLAYHDMPAKVLSGQELEKKKFCRTLSDCTTGPRNGMISGCFPLDPYYMKMPEAKTVREIRSAATKQRK